MSPSPSSEPTCEFCDKRGLPILLARFAIAAKAGKAPDNPATGGQGPINTLGDDAHYTMRLLRSGYLYTFDEARKRWEGYFITPQAYLLKFPVGVPMAPSFAQGREPCARSGHRELAGLVTVPDARNATKVWFGFSDVEWSPATLEKHAAESYRRRHMEVMDVKAWLAGKGANPLRPIAQVTGLVSEYVPTIDPSGFKFSPFAWATRSGEAQGLVAKADACLKGKGAILVLNDPAGLAQELAALMKTRADDFANVPSRQWRLASSAAIEQIHAAIRNQAELEEMSAAETLANDATANAGLGILFESTRKSIEDLRTVTAAELKRAADHAWAKYSSKYDEPARRAWQDSFNRDLKAFDVRYIAPIAQAHADWLKSTCMADYFDCNFDSQDAARGLVYTQVLTQCIGATQDKGACAALYDQWLSTNDASDRSNLLMRAMVLNLDVVADKVSEAAKVSIDPRILQWDALLAVRDKALERVHDQAGDVSARFITEIGGPLARILGRWADGTPGLRAAVMATGLISGHPVVLCDVVGGRKAFRAVLIRQLMKASGQSVSERQIQRAVAAELRRLEIHGVRLDGTDKKRWIIMADKDLLQTMPPGLKGQAAADWLAGSVKTVEHVEGLNLERWRTVINGSVRVGVVAGIIQFVSLGKLLDDADKAMSDDATDAKYRAYAGIAALGGTTADVIGSAIAGRAALGLKFGEGTLMRTGIFLKFVGKGAGLGVGLVLAGLDFVKAQEAASENNPGLAIAYRVSAIAGIGLSLALLGSALLGAAAIPVIGILMLLLLGVTILIEYLKDNKIQDWLERTEWGALVTEHYKNFETSQKELKQALAG